MAVQDSLYSPLVVEHFERPRHAGQLPAGPDVIRTHAGNRAAGAEVCLSFRITSGRIAAVRFQAFGCPHFLAAASFATELLPGMELQALRSWCVRDLHAALAVPVEKRGRLLILEDAVRAAAQTTNA